MGSRPYQLAEGTTQNTAQYRQEIVSVAPGLWSKFSWYIRRFLKVVYQKESEVSKTAYALLYARVYHSTLAMRFTLKGYFW